MKQAFIFDLDGTFYSRKSRMYQSISSKVRQWFKEQLHIHEEDMDTYYESLQATYPNPFDAIEQLGLSVASFHAKVFDELNPEEYLTKDTTLNCALESLSGEKFIVTQSSYEYAVRVLKSLGIYHYFTDIYIRNLNWYTTNKLDAYNAISQKYQLEPSIIFVIGDNPIVDLQAAYGEGYQCIAISDSPVIGMQIIRSVPEILTIIS